MSELRKEFEKIAYKNKWNINKDPHDFYVDDFVNGAWWAFEEQQAKIDELQKRVDEVCDLLDRAEVNHKHLLTKYQSTKAMEMSSSKMLSRVDQILNALNESMKDFKEMDLYDKGYRVAVGYVIADLEKALRGENDQSN